MSARDLPSGPEAIESSLRDELASSHANLDRLTREYEDLLSDPDAIQEDRDSVRQLLEEARASAIAAERAVERLEAGQYGRCERCGKPIAPERLEAIPNATTCVTC